MTADPQRLLDGLLNLPVQVERASVRTFSVAVTPYDEGGRPSSEVVVEGAGHRGRGECVAFDAEAHAAFAARLAEDPPAGEGLVREWRVEGTPYERAAIEAAVIDLALRQEGVSLAELAGGGTRGLLKTWVSFDRCDDPAARATRIQENNPTARFKIDVDASWTDAAIRPLREIELAVLDFKHAPNRELASHLRGYFPAVLFEDPPPLLGGGPVGRDQTILAPYLAGAVPVTEHVNLKAARMGGWFSMLEALEACRRRGVQTYFGGMFELGVGRRQARKLARLFAPDAWHDLAPIPMREEAPRDFDCPVDPTGVGF